MEIRMPLDLTPGAIYRRTDLHLRYGGQRQGGISTPASHSVVLIFTGYAGGQHRYADGWSRGVFCYFGEGQQGDMEWSRGNAAIRDHVAHGCDLLLFEMLETPRSHVRFLGPFACGSWEYREAPDRTGAVRRAIVFHLTPVSDAPASVSAPLAPNGNLTELRACALAAEAEVPPRSTTAALLTYIERSAAVRTYALARAAGKCERCGQAAPFSTPDNLPFLEVHHIRRLTDGGPDQINAVAAICPNCHRHLHYGKDGDALNSELGEKISRIERMVASP
jgi:5-methylcytosine-specific restriction protein A